ncbi:hypothetical protein CVT91_02565 [Candidatus Atribacteria bacterium HGW-Atribacteria-1]|nr:MAG: hypothetical protein CVT91_02565 [Candidatus Atribacteria bacterium HGW-Atribacteria-1]
MKKQLIVGILMVFAVAFLVGCAQGELGSKFPEKIGEYSKNNFIEMPLCPNMESFIHLNYWSDQGWASLYYTTYKTEEAARKEYVSGKESGRKECEIVDIRGMCKTDFSYETVRVSFGWREGKKFKLVSISKRKKVSESIEDIERQSKEKLIMFVDAFKGL